MQLHPGFGPKQKSKVQIVRAVLIWRLMFTYTRVAMVMITVTLVSKHKRLTNGRCDTVYCSSRAIRDYRNCWLHHVTSRWILITHMHVNTFTYGVLYLHSWSISVVPLYASEYIRFIDRSIGLRLHAMIPWNPLVLSCTSICVTKNTVWLFNIATENCLSAHDPPS